MRGATRIRAIAKGFVDAFAADGEVDLIKQFAYPLPLAVIMELLEIPLADRASRPGTASWP